ncbi:MAG TPA: methyltransferase domain-containing protein [Niastella sp.]
METILKLDLGCGGSKREGYLGVDSLSLPGVDVVHNLTQYPYPFEDGTVHEVWMDNVLEHLQNPLRVMEEIYRICAPGAAVYIAVPYFRSFYAAIDPTHVNFFGVWWFNYFDPGHKFHHKYQYSQAKFKVEHIEFDREFKKDKIGFFHKRLIRFAEKRPESYEAKLSHLFPLNSLTFSLRVIK